jgi:asparagine synthase (glutamine-hydrolysing)
MRFQHLLGERTFFEGIRFLPGASTLVFDAQTGHARVSHYWSYAEIVASENLTFSDAVDETGRLLRQAVRRLTSDNLRPGVFLSGGLDGRTIIGLIEKKPVASLSFGEANSRDVVYSRRIAASVGSKHAWVQFLDGKWVLDQIRLHLELTEGFHSWIHMHGMSALPLARAMMDVNLSGWDGGTVMGHSDSIEPLQVNPVTEEAFLIRQFYIFNNIFTWPGLNEVEERLLYQDPLAQKMIGLAFDSMRDEYKKYWNLRPEVRQEFFYIDNHCRRLTHNMIVFGRSHIEQRFPFFDYDLFNFLYSLPPQFRVDRRLYLAVINKEIPSLTRIPYDHDDLPPVVKGRMRYKLWRWLQWQINQKVTPLFPEYKTLYADYENYLRDDLCSWGEEILFDHRTKDRGIFNPSFLDTIWKRHMSRQEYHTIGKIAPIMTYEMMLRRFYD